jgi:cell division septation protein DedD
MSDQRAHEIQLSGKQLVFLFMSGVAVLVVVFLLGVSVGRGVATEALAGEPMPADPIAGGTDISTAPPPTDAAAADLSYDRVLTDRAATPNRTTNPPAPQPEPPAPPPAAPPQTQTAPPPPPPPAPATGDGWIVQVGAFSSRENADRVVAQLSGKGFKAFIAPSGSLHRVRVGPFANRADADRALADLKREGHPGAAVQKEGLRP